MSPNCPRGQLWPSHLFAYEDCKDNRCSRSADTYSNISRRSEVFKRVVSFKGALKPAKTPYLVSIISTSAILTDCQVLQQMAFTTRQAVYIRVLWSSSNLVARSTHPHNIASSTLQSRAVTSNTPQYHQLRLPRCPLTSGLNVAQLRRPVFPSRPYSTISSACTAVLNLHPVILSPIVFTGLVVVLWAYKVTSQPMHSRLATSATVLMPGTRRYSA